MGDGGAINGGRPDGRGRCPRGGAPTNDSLCVGGVDAMRLLRLQQQIDVFSDGGYWFARRRRRFAHSGGGGNSGVCSGGGGGEKACQNWRWW